MEPMSLVKAMQTFFSDNSDGYGRKIDIAEFKQLTDKDKAEFQTMLEERGYNIVPFKSSSA